MKQLYFGGEILTMEPGRRCPEALLVHNGRIEAVGDRRRMELRAGENCRRVDLKGKTLCPGFIDGHSHLTMQAMALGMLDLSACRSFAEITARIRAFAREQALGAEDWILAYGYDHTLLREGRHPDKQVLEQAGIAQPLLLTHVSGHMGVMNQKGLDLMGVSGDTPDPPDGVIGRAEGSREPSGYLEEGAFLRTSARVPKPSAKQVLHQMEAAQRLYFSYGITTIQEGYAKEAEWAILKAFSDSGKMKADVAAYADIKEAAGLLEEDKSYAGRYQNHLRLGGYKLFLDGSPQGRTAWLSEPYAGAEDGYRGYPIYPDDAVQDYVDRAYREGVQLLVHCNGDAAAEQMITCCTRAAEKFPGQAIRPVMIHAQLVRRDQLQRMEEIGMLASFFVGHLYHWGEVHLENLGESRASRISPVRSAIEAGVRVSFHQDTPVLPPDVMESVACAVCRKSRTGRVLGAEERCSVEEALSAMTSWAAYGYFEEGQKGTLAPGKMADMVILDRDPRRCPPEELCKIQVLQTIKDGEVVYTKENEG